MSKLQYYESQIRYYELMLDEACASSDIDFIIKYSQAIAFYKLKCKGKIAKEFEKDVEWIHLEDLRGSFKEVKR